MLKTRLRKATDDLTGRFNALTTKRKPALLLALGTQAFWLTPSLYKQLQYTNQWWRVPICIWIAVTAWAWSAGMLMPQMEQYVETALNRAGPHLGYWDPRFASKASKFLISSFCGILILSLACADWLTVHAIRIVHQSARSDIIKSPPFGYFATVVAGNFVGLSAFTGLIAFAAQPLSAPVWQWFSRPGQVQCWFAVFVSFGVFFAHMRWQQSSARRDEEVFGSRLKGLFARVGACTIGFGILLALG